MKRIPKLLFKYLHFIILIFGVYTLWGDYEEFNNNVQEKEEQISVIQVRVGKLKKRVKLLDGFLEDLNESKKQLNDILAEFEQIQQQLPEEIRDTDVLDLFSREADFMNIKDVFLQPREEKTREFYVAKQYEIKATGTYLQFLVYFERLEKKPRLIDVVQLSLVNSSSAKNKGRFQLVDVNAKIEVFKYSSQTDNSKDATDKEEKSGGKG